LALKTASTLQVCRECGGGAPADAHFCPQCTKLLPLGRAADYFRFLGLPRKLQLNPADLERRFRDLSRQFHPDYFCNASVSERRASLERSSYLNDAYRTLKQPIGRVEYLLQLEGLASANPQEASKQVPPELLQDVFALNEELDEIRELRAGGAPAAEVRARLERARQPIDEKRAEHEAQLEALSGQWDALPDAASSAERLAVLAALRNRVMERSYIRNLLAGIERELSQ
jgi:molecular chaperone HscB